MCETAFETGGDDARRAKKVQLKFYNYHWKNDTDEKLWWKFTLYEWGYSRIEKIQKQPENCNKNQKKADAKLLEAYILCRKRNIGKTK